MNGFKKSLAIIPARAGSKRLPEKNIKSLFGKPLVGWTAEQAMRCQYFDKVIISTDCEKIASIAHSYGVTVPFMRPKSLSQDNSSSIDVVEHALDFLESQGELYDSIALLEPTSPLRTHFDLDRAMELFLNNLDKYDALISLGKIDREHPAVIKTIGADNVLKPLTTCHKDSEAYFPYGVIYASKVSTLRETKTFYQMRSLSYIIERWQNFEIDDMVDFHCVEKIIEVFSKSL